MQEIDKILYEMGYLDSDPLKREIVQTYVDEAIEFMRASGVPEDVINSQNAHSVKSLWATYRDEKNPAEIVSKNGMIAHLICSLRRRSQ